MFIVAPFSWMMGKETGWKFLDRGTGVWAGLRRKPRGPEKEEGQELSGVRSMQVL